MNLTKQIFILSLAFVLVGQGCVGGASEAPSETSTSDPAPKVLDSLWIGEWVMVSETIDDEVNPVYGKKLKIEPGVTVTEDYSKLIGLPARCLSEGEVMFSLEQYGKDALVVHESTTTVPKVTCELREGSQVPESFESIGWALKVDDEGEALTATYVTLDARTVQEYEKQ